MDKITVDGCNYHVDISNGAEFCDHISITDDYHDEIGSAVVNHNLEYATVYYSETGESASYNYYELEAGKNGLLKLAEWIVATDPINC